MWTLHMIFKHRQNGILLNDESEYAGIELDIRSHPSGLVVNHDPIDYNLEYLSLDDKLLCAKELIVIANVKESGVEEPAIDIFEKNKVDYYFLDSQIPDIIRLSKSFPEIKNRFILRVSDLETLNYSFFNLVQPKFIWLDYSKFDDFCQNEYLIFINNSIKEINNLGAIPILVSPELYKLQYRSYITPELQEQIYGQYNVCTKYPELWEKYVDKFN